MTINADINTGGPSPRSLRQRRPPRPEPPSPWVNISAVPYCRICWFCRTRFEQGDIVIQAINKGGCVAFYCEGCFKHSKYIEEKRFKIDLLEPGERIALRRKLLKGGFINADQNH